MVVFFRDFVSSGQNGCCFFTINFELKIFKLSLFYQFKRKWALLESNLPGIKLMTDKNIKYKEFFRELLCYF